MSDAPVQQLPIQTVMTEQDLGVGHPKLQRLYAYWLAKRGERTFPNRQDFDPVEVSFALSGIVLLDVLYEPLRFRYRVVGTDLVRRDGYDMTGKMVDEIPEPEFRAFLLTAFRTAAAEGKPSYFTRELRVDFRIRRYETLQLPFSEDGVKPSMLMYCTQNLAP